MNLQKPKHLYDMLTKEQPATQLIEDPKLCSLILRTGLEPISTS